MTTLQTRTRSVSSVASDARKHWVGDGFSVRTLLSYDGAPAAVSPFLLLDYAAPREFTPTPHQRGVGQHPHRGFETVTIAYQGEVEHRDSTGAEGKIGPGGVQWMTAASGIVHEERHSRDFARAGGTFEMVQLWVNLPARLKMASPAYQDLRAETIPSVELEGGAGAARVIAGELQGVKGPARTSSPVHLWDLSLRAGRPAELAIPEGYTAALLVRAGSLNIGGRRVGPAELAHLDRRGDRVRLDVLEDTTALLLAGEPIDEPVVGYGPFVMNTADEIQQAFADFQSGRLGR
jgi:redox-sensitive bicupin YhaK (pirin superfamily)